MQNKQHWDESTDVIIVGSGAGAMTAAIRAHDSGLKVLILEKSTTFGGTSAMSGGSMWVPFNHHMSAPQLADNPEKAWNYLKACIGPDINEERIKAYINNAATVFEYLEDKTHLRFKTIVNAPSDYYPEHPGSCNQRTLHTLPFPAKRLGKDLVKLHPEHPQALLFGGRMTPTVEEAITIVKMNLSSLGVLFILIMKYLWGRITCWNTAHPPRLCGGSALTAGLYLSLMDRNVPIRYEANVCDLISHEHGVEGVAIEKDNKRFFIQAKRGVILATGGFAKNQIMREKYLKKPTNALWSNVQFYDQGDGIKMAQRIGADVALMDEGWWMPVFLYKNQQPFFVLYERTLPGSIIVNQNGKRFANEASSYYAFIQHMYKSNEVSENNFPAYLIMDQRFRNTYHLGNIPPARFLWSDSLTNKLYENFGIKKANTLEALARELSINKDNLAQTVARFNKYARDGKDPDFHRGESSYDHFYADPKIKPNPCLYPLEKSPFFGIPIYPGDIGTKGGICTNAYGQVLNKDGLVIQNLYATGNCTASAMGISYPGAGSTLGPAMVFGYMAAQHIAKVNSYERR